jgi:cytochrome P450
MERGTTMARIEAFDDTGYDPFQSDGINFGAEADPYPLIHQLRAEGAVHRGDYRSRFGLPIALPPGKQAFTIVGTDAITQVLTDQSRFSNKAYASNLGTSFGLGSVSTMDNPEHARFRRIFQRIFLPQHIKSWGDSIVTPVVQELMNRFIPRGAADLVQDFTILYPFEVIYRQLDLPGDDIATFQKMAIAQTDFFSPGKAVEAGAKLGRYFEALVAERRSGPGDDLVSLLASTEVDGEVLPPIVLISFLRQLMNAAGDTTYRGTSILFTALLNNPDQLEAIRKDRTLIAPAIEEALRFDGPVLVQTREALVDTELGGVAIPAGSWLEVVAGAANRDPAIWDAPDTYNILRKRDSHWAFSRGPHICLGQHLARIEMTRALEAVLDNLPGLRLDPHKPPPQVRGTMMRAPEHLFVRFGN